MLNISLWELVIPLIALAATAFWIWMLIECATQSLPTSSGRRSIFGSDGRSARR